MRKAKLNTHTDASGILCACIPIRVTRRNGWHEISGAGACRCRSCWPRPMCWTPKPFLGSENFFPRSALHIVGEGGRERSLDYISNLWSRMDIMVSIKTLAPKILFFNLVPHLHWQYPVLRQDHAVKKSSSMSTLTLLPVKICRSIQLESRIITLHVIGCSDPNTP